ncbi:MAG: hypothetical protein GXO25_08040, partial [Euryarchaeota archaeon]|nr:hypothetical protein [Euryarchaeota archaeon]
LMLFAWDIEIHLFHITQGNLPSNWYYAIYLSDFLCVLVAIETVIQVYRDGIISTLKLFYLFFPIFMLVFLLTGGQYYYWRTVDYRIYTTVITFFASVIILNELRNLFGKKLSLSVIEGDSDISIFSAVGSSMNPTIKKNDIVVVYTGNIGRFLKHGEILFIRIPFIYAPMLEGKYVAHRMLKRMGNYVITKGDNEAKKDRDIPLWYVEGIVIGKIHLVGRFIDFTKLTSYDELVLKYKRNEKKIKELLIKYGDLKKTHQCFKVFIILFSLIFAVLLWIF